MGEDLRLAVLVSGAGSILEAILDAGLEVEVVLADRVCRALDIARDARVEVELVDRGDFGGFSKGFDRDGYTRRLVEVLYAHRVDILAMAGFGTVLSNEVHRAFGGRILNTHPSLLPDFPGWHAVADALEAGVEVTGCTVHLATLETDAGPVLAQREVRVLPGDTTESLHERIKQSERVLYPATIKRFMEQFPRSHVRPRSAGPSSFQVVGP